MTGTNYAGGAEFAAIDLWASPPPILMIAAVTLLSTAAEATADMGNRRDRRWLGGSVAARHQLRELETAMTIKRYLDDRALNGVVEVTAVIPGDRPIVRCNETWFHAQGGGQKADRGTLAAIPVLDVRHAPDGAVDHIVAVSDGLEVGGRYAFAVDEEWRVLNSKFHTAAHLLVSVCESMFPSVSVIAGHQWPGEARVDFVGEAVEEIIERSDQLEQVIRDEIRRDLPVTFVGDPYVSRACQIGGYAPIACSGTHALSTGELGQFRIRSAKLKRGQLRLGYEITAA
ncbi:Ser-tRNA(Ala) deacylase AlaX [Nitrospirillum iridis]|uniref:Ser-tRNA(Ala) deacylase AlaX n=2 Tax=Nitrospirillum iridis TaxID=765888 RepID=A0A7X0B2L1_9PROT|nr:Ser-tRNA(Ala) deacylase AlaX [Nitrospirillum iridis]